jgi:hypothetical protein
MCSYDVYFVLFEDINLKLEYIFLPRKILLKRLLAIFFFTIRIQVFKAALA